MRELESVVLTTDLAEYGLERGDIGTIVYRGGKGYEVEFVALDGETVAIASVRLPRCGRSLARENRHVRPVINTLFPQPQHAST